MLCNGLGNEPSQQVTNHQASRAPAWFAEGAKTYGKPIGVQPHSRWGLAQHHGVLGAGSERSSARAAGAASRMSSGSGR